MNLTCVRTLDFCQLGDAGITSLAAICPQLNYLDINGQQFVSETGLRALGQYCKKLRYLYAARANAIVYQPDALDALADTILFPMLSYVTLKSIDRSVTSECPVFNKARRDANNALRRLVYEREKRIVVHLTRNPDCLRFYPDALKFQGVVINGDPQGRYHY